MPILPASILRWNSDHLSQFLKENNLQQPIHDIKIKAFFALCRENKLAYVANILEENVYTVVDLYQSIESYIGNHLVEALMEEFQHNSIEISDQMFERLESYYIENYEELLNIYLAFNKAKLLRLSKQLNRLEQSQTIKELGTQEIYLDGILHQGDSGICVYDALKFTKPVVCKYFPSSAANDAEKEWKISKMLQEKVRNSSYVIHIDEMVITKSGACYLVMQNYGNWSLYDVAARKFKDNFYKDRHHPQFPQTLLKKICCSIVSGLKCLELIGYCHSDIKLANIMLAHDGTPLIIDLGSCREMDNKIANRSGLTPSYANSCLHFAKSNSHYDLLCLSLVLYHLWNGNDIEKSHTRSNDYQLSFSDNSLCSQFGSLLKKGCSLDETYVALKNVGLWDVSVVWPSLK